MDSIRENVKFEDMVATLKAELSYDINHRLNLVVVEGKDDIKFIKKNFCNQNIVCYESFSGKNDLNQIITDPRIRDERIIAIRDKDYVDKSNLPKRMWTYDTCCLETMLIKNKEVQKSMFQTYAKEEVQWDEFYENVFRELVPISILRKKNERDEKSINFNKMRLLDCYKEGKIDTLSVFRNIEQDESIHGQCCLEGKDLSNEELLDITNGHDLCKILGVIFISGKGAMGEDRVRDAMICTFRKGDFAETDLYKDLLEYQRVHNVKYVDE